MPTPAKPSPHIAEAVRRIINLAPGAEFVTSEITDQLRRDGWPPLPEPRALGGVLRGLRSAGVITKAGACAHSSRSHGGIATVWRRTQTHS